VVAAEVGRSLEASLDVVVALPFGPPGSPDLSVGAVASDGTVVVDEALASRLGLGPADLAPEEARAASEAARRERSLRAGGERRLAGRTVVVVDDGVAGGATMRAALALVRRGRPAWLVCAVPIGPPATIDLLAAEADEVVCPLQSLRFGSVEEWYEAFPEVGDDEVRALLEAQGS